MDIHKDLIQSARLIITYNLNVVLKFILRVQESKDKLNVKISRNEHNKNTTTNFKNDHLIPNMCW